MRILLAEDQRDLNRLLTKRLRDEKYSVDSCFNGQEALDYLDGAQYDAVIMDIMMPKMSGLEALKIIRARKNYVPVLLLTAMDSIEDRVRGLDAGADDYLVKPFAFEELMARIRVMLRKPVAVQTNVYTVGDLEVHVDTMKVKRGGKDIPLSAKEFALLRYMVQNAGIVLSRERLEQHIWNYDYSGGSNVIDVYIRYLRKKIDDGFDNKLIHTIRGAGYVIKEGES
ncbi:DNA-binding response OmpR family regulator [Catenibacillus scindens]|uniref:Stage 0 sporulation protein A homolog n=1 Tax=Catenibacillus scindens TaxID=673271 RepID=A0A7W8H8B6_9FIRM|nr:DNA-binding response OmpR family regulator [Catenibacillus scindens]